MSWNKISQAVGKFAPLAGSMLGGPAGGTVGTLIASALGVDNTPDAVAAAIAQDPSASLKLKELELKHAADFEQMAIEQYKAEATDRANARSANSHSRMPALICIGLTVMVAGGAVMLFSLDIPDGNREIAYLLFGTLLAKWGDSIAYWVGTTRSSAVKTSLMSK